MENKNVFKKYTNWFDIISQKCNEENFVETIDKGQFKGFMHYVLNNDLNVYIKENGNIRISDGDLEKLTYFERSLVAEAILFRIHSSAAILYSKDVLKNGNYLPKNLLEETKKETNRSTYENTMNIDDLLMKSINSSLNYETRQIYIDALNMYTKISEIVELEELRVNDEKKEIKTEEENAKKEDKKEPEEKEFKGFTVKTKDEIKNEVDVKVENKAQIEDKKEDGTKFEEFSLEELEKMKDKLLKENEKARIELQKVNEVREKLIQEIKELKDENNNLKNQLSEAKKNKPLFSIE